MDEKDFIVGLNVPIMMERGEEKLCVGGGGAGWGKRSEYELIIRITYGKGIERNCMEFIPKQRGGDRGW